MQHLALVMDGNRRWAKSRAMPAWFGHRQGSKTVEMVMKYCIDQKIPFLSLYTFSLENLQRSNEEVSYLFSMIQEMQSRIKEFIDAGVKVRFVGDLSFVPTETRSVCEMIEQSTTHGDKLQCNFLFCYGGQQEIIAAAQSLVLQGQQTMVTKDLFRSYLWSGSIPDPEIIIRTGGVQRLSNFLLFQAAYAEIRFLDCFWPDLTRELLDATVQHCLKSQKNFGS
jgi:undecaprenyl diphosphate synthase